MLDGLFGETQEVEQLAPKETQPKSPKNPSSSGDAMRFEDAYSRLEELVGEMEAGELPLEDLLSRFEEGVKLVKHCQGFLKQAQLRVEQYVEQKDGRWVLKDLDGK